MSMSSHQRAIWSGLSFHPAKIFELQFYHPHLGGTGKSIHRIWLVKFNSPHRPLFFFKAISTLSKNRRWMSLLLVFIEYIFLWFAHEFFIVHIYLSCMSGCVRHVILFPLLDWMSVMFLNGWRPKLLGLFLDWIFFSFFYLPFFLFFFLF